MTTLPLALSIPGRLNTPAARAKTLALPVLQAVLLSLAGCGGSGGSSETEAGPAGSPQDGQTVAVSAFEGTVTTLSSVLVDAPLQWQQLEGPPLTVATDGSAAATLTLPWLITGPAQAVVEASATVNGQTVKQRFEIEILDRRYLALRLHDTDRNATDLALRYVSANDEEGIPSAPMGPITALPSGSAVCGWAISPSGRYIAYSVNTITQGFMPVCRGLYLVDVGSGDQRRISRIGRDGQDVIVGVPRWSADETRVAYQGDHGEGLTQLYSIEVGTSTTSYVNYGNNTLNLPIWPAQDLFPVPDGGNPHGLEFVDSPAFFGFETTWLGPTLGLAFTVEDSATGEYQVHLASTHGDAQALERMAAIEERVFALDEAALADYMESLLDCPVDGICAVVPLPPVPLIVIDRRYVNPFPLESSVEGHLMFMATMLTNIGSHHRVMTVASPVVAGTPSSPATPIEAFDVFDAAWSPTAVDLAFAANSELRHAYPDEADLQDPADLRLTGREIPGQLYLYQGYRQGHTAAQERLAYPQPEVDDNPVVRLEWSPDGRSIAYARGNDNQTEGPFLTSLWVVRLDAVRDERPATIDANTVLLANLRGSSVNMTDFIWAPDGAGLLALVEDGFPREKRLRYLRRDGAGSFDSPLLTGYVDDLASLPVSFSPDGQHYAYINEGTLRDGDNPALYIQPVDGSARIRISAPLPDGARLSDTLPWSPHGNAVVYAVSNQGAREFYLARVDGTHQPLAEFFDAGQQIVEVRVK